MNSSCDVMGLFVFLLGEKDEEKGGEERGDPYTKWRIKSSKSLSEQEESTMKR
jgi:hypothetical protein